jgi:sulfoxide reductase heme-binding subunit YedZ
MRAALRHPFTWWLLLGVGLLPLVWLLAQALQDQLGANPAEALIRALGDWTLRSLCVVLAVTPLRTGLGWPELLRFRRMLGLLCFGYACLHLLSYAWFDLGFDGAEMVWDIAKRPFILVGFTAFVILVALAATSSNRAVRWLGGKRWQGLHRSVYAVAVLAILHFWWMRAGKQDFAEVVVYTAILAVLLGWRLWRWLAQRRVKASAADPKP